MNNFSQESVTDKSIIPVCIDLDLKEQDELLFSQLVEETKHFSQKFIHSPSDWLKTYESTVLKENLFLITSENNLSSYADTENKKNIFFLEKQELSLFSNESLLDSSNSYQKVDIHEIKLLPYRLEKKFYDDLNERLVLHKEKSFKCLRKVKSRESKYHNYLSSKLLNLKKKTNEVQVIEELNRFEEFSFQVKSRDELKMGIINFWFEYFGEELFFLQVHQVGELKSSSCLLPVIVNNEIEEFIHLNNFEYKEQSSFVLVHLFRIYSSFFIRDGLINRFEDEHKIWESSFFKIKTPMALFNEQGDLIRHNNKFINLRLKAKDCLQLENDQTLNISSNSYKVFKKEIDFNNSKSLFFVFLSGNHSNSKEILATSSEELGIVSSSIAHELNNPLAGILAALTVFELEDDIEDETKEHLREMKKGAQRCRDLIQTFLGFSKIKPVDIKNIQSKGHELAMKSFEQAFHLIRFRLIENNLKLNVIRKNIDSFGHAFNGSVLAMVFYLVLGEIITAFSHYLLVSHTDNKTLNGEIIENKNYIEIKLYQDFEYKNQITDSKLIQHLVRYLGLDLTLDESIKLLPSAERFLIKDETLENQSY